MIRIFTFIIAMSVIFLTGCASTAGYSSPSAFSNALNDPNGWEGGTMKALQHDFDIARLNHLATISGYIEDYKTATGSYPYADSDIPVYVHIATAEQQQFVAGSPPYEHSVVPVTSLLELLQNELGDDVTMPFDPQKIPTNAPNFYIYMAVQNTYFLAVQTHFHMPFSTQVANFYNKTEVTNNPDAVRQGVWLRNDLLNSQAFKDVIATTPYKPGYTDSVLEQQGGNDAFYP